MKSLYLTAVGLLVLIAFASGCASHSERTEAQAESKQEVAQRDYYNLIKAGHDKMGVGDYDAALAYFDRAIALDSTQLIGYAYRGSARHEKGYVEGALADFSRIPDGDINYVFAYVARGSAKLAQGDNVGAVADFEQAVFLTPNNARVFASLAIAKKVQGDFVGAIAAADRALAIDPNLGSAYSARGLAKRHLGDNAGAIADFDHLIALSPRDTGALYNRGMIKAQAGDLDGALADYTQALAIYPTNSFAYNGIARLRESKGDFAGAQEAYLKSIAVEPWRATYNRFALALILRRQHLDDSPAGLAGAVKGWSEGWTKTLGNFLLGKLTETELVANAETGTPQSTREQRCEAYYYAGMMHLISDDRDSARRLFEQCIATGITALGEYQAAGRELRRLAEASPTELSGALDTRATH